MPAEYFSVPDGLDEIKQALPVFIELLAQTARWVHPDSFRALQVWYPEYSRGRDNYKADWITPQLNKKRNQQVKEANIKAGTALRAALGTNSGKKKASNWTVCHIWGTDDPKFQKRNDVVQDPRYYSCVANMIWLPTPLKGFTDSIQEVKFMLRVCAFYTYDWVCEHETVHKDAERIKSGEVPDGYPPSWPRRIGDPPPPGTAPYSERVKKAVERRKRKLCRQLAHSELPMFPREQVRKVLDSWHVTL